MDEMRRIIESYLESVEQIKSFENRINELIKEILDYQFERGKYSGRTVYDVVLSDPGYVNYWINSNLPYTSIETLKLPTLISESAKGLRGVRKDEEGTGV